MRHCFGYALPCWGLWLAYALSDDGDKNWKDAVATLLLDSLARVAYVLLAVAALPLWILGRLTVGWTRPSKSTRESKGTG